jgi:hypothetical protein
MVQLRLGLHDLIPIPSICPDCGIKNNIDHCLDHGCGGAIIKRHNEIRDFALALAGEAKFHIPENKEPVVGKLDEADPDNRCDGRIRGLWTPQRDCWIDALCIDTAAPSYMLQAPEKTLENGEMAKVSKHALRVSLAENADFTPIVCSVHGLLAHQSQQFVIKCTERMVGGKSADSSDFSQVLHWNRARFQAAVWRATSLCLVGRGRRLRRH